MNEGMGAVANTAGSMLSSYVSDIRNQAHIKDNTRLNVRANKELSDYNVQKQLELFEKTGFGAQRKQLEDAGLSVGLMYGKGGGSGGSTNISQGSVNVPTIPSKPADMDIAMQMAQIKLAESQARKNNVDANIAEGVGKDKIVAETGSITQGIKNQQAQEKLMEIEYDNKQLDAELKEATLNDNIALTRTNLKNAEKQTYLLEQQGKITKAEADNINTKIKLQNLNMSLDNALKSTENQALKADIINRWKNANANTKNADTNARALEQKEFQMHLEAALKREGYSLQETKMYMDAIMGLIGRAPTTKTEYTTDNTGKETWKETKTGN